MLVDGLVVDVQVHEHSARSSKCLEVWCEGHSREIALQVVLVSLSPVGGVHHPVEVFPNVVFGDVIAIVDVELLQAPVGDVVGVCVFRGKIKVKSERS